MIELTTPRKINDALARYVLGNRGNPVYCQLHGESHRISWSRTVHGRLQVKLLSTGKWVTPEKVYQ